MRGVDFGIDRMGRPVQERGRGARRQSNPNQRRFTEGTLAIDATRGDTRELVWRGVYRDDERTGSKLTYKLPEDAKRLLAKYPKLTR